MGRRSIHTPDQLRELIISATTCLLQEEGLCGLSAREVARRIAYSPGTIYNVFQNLDDLLLTIEGRMLDRLAERLDAATAGECPDGQMLLLADTYTRFTHENPRLWNLLFEHRMPAGTEVPNWYKQKLDGLMSRVEAALAPLFADGDRDDIRRAAHVIWAGVHGITSLSTADKLSNITTESAQPMVRDLVTTFLDGIKARNPGPPHAEARRGVDTSVRDGASGSVCDGASGRR